jgi:hypothetical protein
MKKYLLSLLMISSLAPHCTKTTYEIYEKNLQNLKFGYLLGICPLKLAVYLLEENIIKDSLPVPFKVGFVLGVSTLGLIIYGTKKLITYGMKKFKNHGSKEKIVQKEAHQNNNNGKELI